MSNQPIQHPVTVKVVPPVEPTPLKRAVVYLRVSTSHQAIREVGELTRNELDARQEHDQAVLANQRQRLIKLERQKQKLIDAHLDEAIPAEDLKPRQAALMAEMNDARRLIAACQDDMVLVASTSSSCSPCSATPEDSTDPPPSNNANGSTSQCSPASPSTSPVTTTAPHPRDHDRENDRRTGPTSDRHHRTRSTGHERPENPRHGPTQRHRGRTPRLGQRPDGAKQNPQRACACRGFNVDNLAETEGFEPSDPLRDLHLSRVVH